jgi:site-specific DNA-methyltransferase (adenine-specific)
MKPIDLMAWLIRLVTPPKGVVLDPFMGSGSTGIAAVRQGFRFIGIERDKGYFEIARRRIEAALEKPDLFIETPRAKPVQEALDLSA